MWLCFVSSLGTLVKGLLHSVAVSPKTTQSRDLLKSLTRLINLYSLDGERIQFNMYEVLRGMRPTQKKAGARPRTPGPEQTLC